ncbi:bis(5'-nucleosyl)-tetraphosphatase (symmetrical) YqeK [Chengkuizengella axinellae]|uniref:bis(5'-nucleosyl)-tetraphosphatase (symmetrical) n=1 Tax=Chengkuizengella axinellae TaxID=3064388 RepID=A0ABT9J2H2_9BACL|nr:bis(5'-nucleosyl)-tetraphosphatase (symmetrical) YqeK [Chengkuizengella sp. 2205SS18-9]MDP5275778.1 bis(5'-nucleosyl)-tetraphosphatase (symmetrical) YqeK [Chengkuizengella sp. 2205SS18-9]
MNSYLLNRMKTFKLTGNLEKDVVNILEIHDKSNIAEHTIRVAYESKKLAHQFKVNPEEAEIAGLLHDISGIFPNHERIQVAKHLNIDILPEEEKFPLIIHQKISSVMAKEIFGIHNLNILDAVSCHTTLRADATSLDKVLFVADKIEWDQKGTPPYIEHLQNQLQLSLEHAAFSYIQFLWDQRASLKVVHPWLADAYFELKEVI